MHQLLAKQLQHALADSGEIDADRLIATVDSAYQEFERDRRRNDDAMAMMMDELAQSHAQYVDAFDVMAEGLLICDADDRVVLWNRSYAEMYAETGSQLEVGMRFEDIMTMCLSHGHFPDAIGREDEWLAHRMELHRLPRSNHESLAKSGRWLRIEERRTRSGGSIGVRIDITELKLRESELRRAEEFLNTIIEKTPVSIVVKDAKDLKYVLINAHTEKHLGIPREQVLGKTAYEIFPKSVADAITNQDRSVVSLMEEVFTDEHVMPTPGSGPRLVTTRRLPVRDEKGKVRYIINVIEDVTERKRAEAKIAHLARHDVLTDLPNRSTFAEHLAVTLDRAEMSGEQFAVMCIDLDRFKEINDIYGHAAGDKLLLEVSHRLQAAAGGAFIARQGGDEFAVIANDEPQPQATEALAGRLLAAVGNEIDIDGHLVRVGMTIGVALYPTDGKDAVTLMANADAALYRAKNDARGSLRFFEPAIDQTLRERRALQKDLRTALGRGDLGLNYQPQALIDGEIVGFEALARWTHPLRGAISPAVFIPLAEESALIVSLGEWVLREACREAASWRRPLQIAVNLSPIQFRQGDLPTLVHEVLLETGLSPGRLELEITEGVLIDDFSRAVSILRRLKSLGVRIAMDDFGTGYSSLSYLQSFPFDKIKIDKSFIANLNNTQSAAIVRTVLALGKGLQLPVVAEGVETSAQLNFLTKEACDEVQGFLIGKPDSIEEYAGLLGRDGRPEIETKGQAQAS